MSDPYNQRLTRAMAELEGSGIKRLNYAPPVFRVARRLGLRPRPPHYMSFLRATLLMGPAFGLLWGAVMWMLSWRGGDLPIIVAVIASLLAGMLFGLLMAVYYRWAGGEAGLTRWEDL